MSTIRPITMPKWGLAMEEGMLARWAVEEGATIDLGQEIMDIETTKIANVLESPVAGVLRRKVVGEGGTVPVGALLGVVSDPDASAAEIDSFVEDFLANFKPARKESGGGPVAAMVEAGPYRLRHLKVGPDTGTPILLLHGFGSDMTSWTFNHAALADDRPVHAIDLPGHGGSSKTVNDGSVQSLALAVIACMDTVGIGTAHIVGHSLGGAIATSIALDAPARVAGLTLIAPAGFGPEISREFIEGFMSESRARKLRPVIEMLVADPRLVTADMVEAVVMFKRLDGALTALRTIAEANFAAGTQRVKLRDRLGDLRAPARIIWGEADRIVPASQSRGLPASIPVTCLPGAGHLVHMEKAEKVNALIKAVAA